MRLCAAIIAVAAVSCVGCPPGEYQSVLSGECTGCPPGPPGQGPICSAPLISGFAGWGCTPTGPAQSSISASVLVLLAQPLQSQSVICIGPAINPLQSFVVSFSMTMTSPLFGGADASWFFFDESQNHAVQLSDLIPGACSCGPQGCGAYDTSPFNKSADFTYTVSVTATYDAIVGAFWFTLSGESGNGHTIAANSYEVSTLGVGALGFGAWNGASAYVRTVTDFVYQAGVTWCPAGAFAQPWGVLTQCVLCAAGSWSAAGAVNCTPCGRGSPCGTPCTAANSSLLPCATAAPSSSAAGSSTGHSPSPALLTSLGALGGLFVGALGLWLAQRMVALRVPSPACGSKDSPLLLAVNE